MASQGNGNDGIGIPKQTGYAQMTFEFGFEGSTPTRGYGSDTKFHLRLDHWQCSSCK